MARDEEVHRIAGKALPVRLASVDAGLLGSLPAENRYELMFDLFRRPAAVAGGIARARDLGEAHRAAADMGAAMTARRVTFNAKAYVDHLLGTGAKMEAFARRDGTETFYIRHIRWVRSWPKPPATDDVQSVVDELKRRGLFGAS